jgi:hypothetical protein
MLREQLALQIQQEKNFKLLDDIWHKVIKEVHENISPAILIEEEIIWRTIRDPQDPKIENLLGRALKTMIEEKNGNNVAYWITRALPDFPVCTQDLKTAQMLFTGAQLRIGDTTVLDTNPESKPIPDWMHLLIPANIEKVTIGIRLVDGAVEFGDLGSMKDALALELPKTNPIRVDVSWEEKSYLFNWDEIPGNDNVRLIDFLKQKFDIPWVETAKIEKFDNGKTIRVSTEKKSLLLKLNNEKTKLNIKIDEVRTDGINIKTEIHEVDIYEKSVLVERYANFKFGEFHSLEVGAGEIELRTVSGERYRLSRKKNPENDIFNDFDLENYYAIIIGISNYQDSNIPNFRFARSNAEGIFHLLSDPKGMELKQDKIKLLLDEEATLLNIKTAISEWLFKMSDENSTILIYFSGHGIMGEKPSFLTFDSISKNSFDSAISYNWFNEQLNPLTSKKIIIFVDAYYGGVNESKFRTK